MYQLHFSVVGLRSSNMSVVSSSELVTPESDTVLLFADNNNINDKKVNYSIQKFVSMVRILFLEQALLANNYW
jgi:hypothetical protein